MNTSHSACLRLHSALAHPSAQINKGQVAWPSVALVGSPWVETGGEPVVPDVVCDRVAESIYTETGELYQRIIYGLVEVSDIANVQIKSCRPVGNEGDGVFSVPIGSCASRYYECIGNSEFECVVNQGYGYGDDGRVGGFSGSRNFIPIQECKQPLFGYT